jgi:hypothetical protein
VSDTTLVAGVLTRLDALTAKLGVGATEVWSIWLGSAWRPMVELVTFAGCMGVLIFGLLLLSARLRAKETYEPEDGAALVYCLAVVAGILTAVVLAVNLSDAIAYLIDPRLYALDQLKGLLGGTQ